MARLLAEWRNPDLIHDSQGYRNRKLRSGRLAELRGEPQPGNVRDLDERRCQFGRGVVAEPSLEFPENVVAGVPAHADDEGKAEPRAVCLIEPGEAGEFLFAQTIEAATALLGGRSIRHWAAGLAGKLGMTADERKLLLMRSVVHGLHQGMMQRFDAGERARGCCRCGSPRRMLEDVAERRDEIRRRRNVKLAQRVAGLCHHALYDPPAPRSIGFSALRRCRKAAGD